MQNRKGEFRKGSGMFSKTTDHFIFITVFTEYCVAKERQTVPLFSHVSIENICPQKAHYATRVTFFHTTAHVLAIRQRNKTKQNGTIFFLCYTSWPANLKLPQRKEMIGHSQVTHVQWSGSLENHQHPVIQNITARRFTCLLVYSHQQ